MVLAGGTAARMGGVDKASIELDGVTLLERALAATMSASRWSWSDSRCPPPVPVTWTIEDPASGGPAAGLLAGLDRFLVEPDLVAVLAVDMPRVNAGTVARLTWAVEADTDVDGAVLADPRRPDAAAGGGLPCTARWQPPGRRRTRSSTGCRCSVWSDCCVSSRWRPSGDEARDVDTWDDLRTSGFASDPVARSRSYVHLGL